MKLIYASERALSFDGDVHTAMTLTESIRNAYDASGMDMPKMLNEIGRAHV